LDIEYINIETFKYLNGLACDCSRLLQSFAEKVKTGARRGLQYKRVVADPTQEQKELLREFPGAYKNVFGVYPEQDKTLNI